MGLEKVNIGELEIFSEIAKLGSLRGVARSRGIEVAQLSRTVSRFEKKLGQKLFERSYNGLFLTPQGARLKENLEELLTSLRQMGDQNSPSEKEILGEIGATNFVVNKAVLPLLAELHRDGVVEKSSVVELPPDRLVLSGIRGIIKIAFHADELDWPSSWVSQKIGEVLWGLFGGKKFFKKKTLQESEVIKEKFIYPVYWSPEGLREVEDSCPLPLRQRSQAIGVSTAWMCLKLIAEFKSLAYLPGSIVNPDSFPDVQKIKVKGWEERIRPIFLSVHSDHISQATFTQLIDRSLKFFG